ncbi:MAG: hypothetical protein GY751_12795 [Bacteroidetes bacterium]|nr:hypothetical protein [Bacteroidota bacterium]
MPGDLSAENTSGESVFLESYSLKVIEIEAPDRQPLFVKEGSLIQVGFPIDGSISGAPSTIPLWYFDEERGIWIEEGSATKTGNTYTGSVSHFSFWNCDDPFPIIELSGKILADSIPVPHLPIHIRRTAATLNAQGSGYTDDVGAFRCGIPANETLEFTMQNVCLQDIYTTTIGPFSTDTDLGNLEIGEFDNQITLNGTVRNCSNVPISTGYVQFEYEGLTSITRITASEFSIPLTACIGTNEVEVTVFDAEGIRKSAPQTVPVTDGTVQMGNFMTCDTLEEYLSYSINGEDFLIWRSLIAENKLPYYHILWANHGYQTIAEEEAFNFTLSDTIPFPGVGSYSYPSSEPFELETYLENYHFFGDGAIWDEIEDMTMNYTTFGATGEYTLGNFNGTIVDGSTYEIEGTFKVIRGF